MNAALYDDDGDRHTREFSTGLAALERHLAQVATNTPPPPPYPTEAPATEPDRSHEGRTRRVRRREAEHQEAHRLLELEGDTSPFQVTSEKVRDKRKAVAEAAALWRLERDPQVLAYRDTRMRRLITTLALVSLLLALAWSTAGVQVFAAQGAEKWSPQWWFAWLAEPFCSLALLMVVGGRAYLSTRGQPLHDRSVDRVEWVFLALTLGMNAWPHLPGVTAKFTVSALVLHLLGPVVAVAVVRCLPRLLAAFSTLAHAPEHTPATGPVDQPDTAPASAPVTEADTDRPARPAAARRTPAPARARRATIPAPQRRTFEQVRTDFTTALTQRPAGFDPTNAESIRRTLKCSKKWATALRAEYTARVQGGDA